MTEKRYRYRCINHMCPLNCYFSTGKEGVPLFCPFGDNLPEFVEVISNEFGELDDRGLYSTSAKKDFQSKQMK